MSNSLQFFFAFLVVAINSLCVVNPTYSQEFTETDRANVREVQKLLQDVGNFLSDQKIDKAADRIRLAQKKLIAISAMGNSKVTSKLQSSHFAIERAITALKANGYSFDPLPTFDELVNNPSGLEIKAGQGSAEALPKSLAKAVKLFKGQDFEKSAEQIRLAQQHMTAIPFTEDSDLVERYKKDYRRIAKAQKLLTEKGFTFDPLPEFDSLLSKTAGSETKDNPVADVDVEASVDAPSVPPTGMDKIRADRKQFFIDLYAMMDLVHDDASAKEAIPKAKELAVRLEAIGNDTAAQLIVGGQAASQKFVKMIQAEKMELMTLLASRKKKVDLSKFPELNQEIQNIGKAMIKGTARSRRRNGTR